MVLTGNMELHGITGITCEKGRRFYETMSKLRSHRAYLIFQLVILGLERLKASAEMTLKKAESKDLGNLGMSWFLAS